MMLLYWHQFVSPSSHPVSNLAVHGNLFQSVSCPGHGDVDFGRHWPALHILLGRDFDHSQYAGYTTLLVCMTRLLYFSGI